MSRSGHRRNRASPLHAALGRVLTARVEKLARVTRTSIGQAVYPDASEETARVSGSLLLSGKAPFPAHRWAELAAEIRLRPENLLRALAREMARASE